MEIVLEEPYNTGTTDLTPVVLKVKEKNPDVVLMVAYVSEAALMTNGFIEQGVMPKAYIATSGGFADPTYFDLTGDNCEYFFDISTWEPDVNRPFSAETNEKFKEKYGYGMNAEAVKAYSAMYIIADALERAGTTDADAICDALAETNLTEGPQQMYSSEVVFDEVLLIGNKGKVKVGTPTIKDAKVVAKVVKEGKQKKVLVFRYKNKTNHDILRGHRQPYTKVEITSIEG